MKEGNPPSLLFPQGSGIKRVATRYARVAIYR